MSYDLDEKYVKNIKKYYRYLKKLIWSFETDQFNIKSQIGIFKNRRDLDKMPHLNHKSLLCCTAPPHSDIRSKIFILLSLRQKSLKTPITQ